MPTARQEVPQNVHLLRQRLSGRSLRLTLGLGMAALLSACGWIRGDRDAREVEVAGPLVNQADQSLLEIVTAQEELSQRYQEDPQAISSIELQRRLQNLADDYNDHLARFPEHRWAYIHYGRLLRRMDQPQDALVYFAKADELPGGDLAAVQQQMGSCLVEMGRPVEALPLFLRAIDLAPEEPEYHYQLGELLRVARAPIVEAEVLSASALDREMMRSFEKACALAPDERDYAIRMAEAHYDLAEPNWQRALALWDELRETARSEAESEAIRLHRGRVLLEMGRPEEALALAEEPISPPLEYSRRRLLAMIEARQDETTPQ